MADRIEIRVSGVGSVVSALQAVGFEVDDLTGALGDIAAQGAQIVAEESPQRTGRLAGSTTGRRGKRKAVIGQAVPYAGVINYGYAARNIAPAGYLQRADERLQPIALRLLEADINRQIKKNGLAT